MAKLVEPINSGSRIGPPAGGRDDNSMSNFWNELPKPIFCLAPMEEVTDVVFREMFARYSGPSGRIHSSQEETLEWGSRPEALVGPLKGKNLSGFPPSKNGFVMFTEFVNVDGLLHETGFERLKIDLEYTENQRPIVAQIWGNNPEKFYKVAQMLVTMGFDGIDINMGCPQDKEIGLGTCAALIKQPKLAGEIIMAVKEGVGSLPVSVKTRLGYSKTDEMEGWLRHLLSFNLAAITLHARTKMEKSKVPAHWEKVKEAVEIRNAEFPMLNAEFKTVIIGNGDIKTRTEGLERIKETGCDGVMIARGAFGNPWLFALGGKNLEENYQPSVKERLEVMLEHAKLFEEKLGKQKSFYIMLKHFKAYASGFDGAHELRAKLLETKNLGEAESIIHEFTSQTDSHQHG